MNSTLRKFGKPILEVALPRAEALTGFRTAAGDYLPHRLQMLVGTYEAEELNLMRPFIWPGQTVIDAGANIGYTARFFAGAVGEAGKVYAFEPNPRIYSLLQGNVAENKQVKTFNLGLSSKNDEITLFTAGNNHSVASFAPEYPAMHLAYKKDESIGSVRVKVVVGDEFVRDEGIDRVDAIKMDVEGWELHVLAGFEKTIANSPGISLFCEFSPPAQKCAGHTQTELLEWLWNHEFAIRYPKDGTLALVSPNEVDQFMADVVARDYVTLFATRRVI